jgi:co-chaperonin GroES (HSP10)
MFHSHEIKGEIRPLQDWVILRPVREKERVRGGILLPDRVEDYGRCEVMAVGPGYRPYMFGLYRPGFVPTEVKVGEFIYIQRFVEGEFKFKLNGDMVYAIRERHLNLVLDPDPVRKSRKSK